MTRDALPPASTEQAGPESSSADEAAADSSAMGQAADAKAWLPWPLPALLVWLLCWGALWVSLRSGWPLWAGIALGCGVGLMLAPLAGQRWRRRMVVLGFPLSLGVWLVTQAGGVPAGGEAASGDASGAGWRWIWLLPLAALAAVYPVRRWRDAPLFPTPQGALAGLAEKARLPAQEVTGEEAINRGAVDARAAHVLDAGCGLGAGLHALHAAYPHAKLTGVEWSWPLAWLCQRRCPYAQIVRGDFWTHPWSGYDMVYVFARPESMARAASKAASELRPGAWLVSLSFEAADWQPSATLDAGGGHQLWLYQAPMRRRQQPPREHAA